MLQSTVVCGQDGDSIAKYNEAYDQIANYVPSSFVSEFLTIDSTSPRRLVPFKLNSIARVRLIHSVKYMYQLSESELDSLDQRIFELASALFLDGKHILISPVGGYGGCPEKLIDTISLCGIQITNLKFCHSCTDAFKDENFIAIFNKTMYSLMNIAPPDAKTRSYYGEYAGKGDKKNKISLRLLSDRTFAMSMDSKQEGKALSGIWYNVGDNLVLVPNNQNNTKPAINTDKSNEGNMRFVLTKKGLEWNQNAVKIKLKRS